MVRSLWTVTRTLTLGPAGAGSLSRLGRGPGRLQACYRVEWKLEGDRGRGDSAVAAAGRRRPASHLLIQMLAPAYQLSALDHSRFIAILYFSLLCLSAWETLYIEQPLQQLSSAASERPQN